VITVHDLSWIRYPETHPRERVQAMTRYFEPALRGARHIITVSDFVKNEVIQEFGLNPAQITTVYNGKEDEISPCTEQELEQTMQQYGLKFKHYVLAVGTLEPRKNLENALHAYMRLPKTVRTYYPMILVGMKGWNNARLEQQMRPLIEAGEIRLLGYVSRQALIEIIAGATGLVYPSIYEGFGLPPLEAMAAGVPVISSNVSSLPEVIGNAGILVNPLDVDALAQAMSQVIDNETLRHDLRKKGLLQSQKFSWSKCVAETAEVYRKAL
jgi:glycosyltransferase involved in cell wall biosynthesis